MKPVLGGLVEFAPLPETVDGVTLARIFGRSHLKTSHWAENLLDIQRTAGNRIRVKTGEIAALLQKHLLNKPESTNSLLASLINAQDQWLSAKPALELLGDVPRNSLVHLRGLTMLAMPGFERRFLYSPIMAIRSGTGPSHVGSPWLTLHEFGLLIGKKLRSAQSLLQYGAFRGVPYAVENGLFQIGQREALRVFGQFVPEADRSQPDLLAHALITGKEKPLIAKQVAKILGIGDSTLNKKINEGWIPQTYFLVPNTNRVFLESRVKEVAGSV